jgi:HEPN domain-containing protein
VQRAQDWLKEAHAELAAARTLFEGGHWSWCCYTCQQAAEKALKALCERFRTPQVGHNLNILLQAVATGTRVPDSIQAASARLNRLYIPTRYPNAFDRGAPTDQFFEPDAQCALDDAREVVRFAEGLIGSA